MVVFCHCEGGNGPPGGFSVQGVKEEWIWLKKRHCDNCGTLYKPKQPVIQGKRGFCKRECKDQFHKSGGSYKRLELAIEKGTKGRLSRLEAENRELRKLWSETESRFVELLGRVERIEREKRGK
jgi:hypothetical protein